MATTRPASLPTSSTGDTGTRTATFELDPGETVTCTFTNTQRGSIHGLKFADLNSNGAQDSGIITEIIDDTGDGAGNTLDVPWGVATDAFPFRRYRRGQSYCALQRFGQNFCFIESGDDDPDILIVHAISPAPRIRTSSSYFVLDPTGYHLPSSTKRRTM